MKKISLLLGTFIVSTAAVAQPTTVKDCQLTQWCALPRVSDVAVFSIDKTLGNDYDCTFTADSNGPSDSHSQVRALIEGRDGYAIKGSNLVTIGVLTDTSTIIHVAGSFNQSSTGKISIRRTPDVSNTHQVFIMCEKKFSA